MYSQMCSRERYTAVKTLPYKKIPADLRSLSRSYTNEAVRIIAAVMRNSEEDSVRVRAAEILLDRGWGRAPQAHTGEDGEGDIRVTIRTIIEGVPARVSQSLKAIEAMPIESNGKSHDE